MKRSSIRWFAALLPLLVLPGCYDIYSGLVPVALPPMAPPERGRLELRAQGTVTTGGAELGDPAEAPDGLYVPRGALGGNVGIRLSRWFSLSPLTGVLFAEGSYQPFGRPAVGPPRGAGFYLGISPALHVPFDRERTVLTVGFDAAVLFIPLRTSEGDQPFMGGLFGGTIGVGRWFSEWLRLRVEVSVRNQATVIQPPSAPTGVGLPAITVGGSARAQLADEVGLELSTQFVGVPPVGVFFPTVTLSLVGTIGDAHLPDPHHPEDAAPTRYGPAPGPTQLREHESAP